MNNCVYLHKDINGVLFYIGSGKVSRAMSNNTRNKIWKQIATGGYSVDILVKELSKQDSLDLEQHLIGKHSPVANIKTKTTHRNYLCKEDLSKIFAVSSNSPSGLIRIGFVEGSGKSKSFVGKPAGSLKYQTDGRPHAWQLMYKSKSYLVHRIIYTLVHGDIPNDLVIDHIDRNPFNNNIENLRAVTESENCKNSTVRRNKSSNSPIGVYLWKNSKCNVTYWVGSNRNNGIRKCKYFSITSFGNDLAYQHAVDFSTKQ